MQSDEKYADTYHSTNNLFFFLNNKVNKQEYCTSIIYILSNYQRIWEKKYRLPEKWLESIHLCLIVCELHWNGNNKRKHKSFIWQWNIQNKMFILKLIYQFFIRIIRFKLIIGKRELWLLTKFWRHLLSKIFHHYVEFFVLLLNE